MSEEQTAIEIQRGDAIRGLQNWKENTFHAAVVDFPWKFDTENGSNRFGHDRSIGDSDLYYPIRGEDMEAVLFHLEYIVRPGGWVFVFADDEVYPEVRRLVESAGWHDDQLTRRQTVYWDSDFMGMGAYHRVQAYPIVTATVGETERYIRDRPNIYRARHVGPQAEYPTMKPVELYRQMFEPPVAHAGERVIEPFAGTFPAGEVAKERGFSAFGYEIREDAIEIAERRIAQRTLTDPTLSAEYGGGRHD